MKSLTPRFALTGFGTALAVAALASSAMSTAGSTRREDDNAGNKLTIGDGTAQTGGGEGTGSEAQQQQGQTGTASEAQQQQQGQAQTAKASETTDKPAAIQATGVRGRRPSAMLGNQKHREVLIGQPGGRTDMVRLSPGPLS